MIEVWRNIVGYEGYYEVSNFGRVKSLERIDIKGRRVPEHILNPFKVKNGYLIVTLKKDGKQKHFSVHRLVAQAFIPNPQNLPQVNHKDEVKTNNFVFVREDGSVDFNKSNLEWITAKKNTRYGTGIERRAKSRSKSVYQYTLDGEFVRSWPSASEVERQTGWNHSAISACCNGKRKSYHGYVWKYVTVS